LSTKSKPLIRKIGLYTSPHLRFVRERIQINNEPLSEEAFAKYFFETWDRLEDSARAQGRPIDQTAKPVYFRFLTLMALHTYMSEGVDTAIIECGIGGEYDSTNIIVSPTVTGITSLGIDHVAMLGETIGEIAWHKAGIMKPGALAFTAPQPSTALEVLQQRAAAKSVTLEIVEPDRSLASLPLGLAGDFQVTNASLAVRVASAHLQTLGLPAPIPGSSLPTEFLRGLRQVRWPGRCETRREKNLTWHIDSGHTLESIQAAATWFVGSLASTMNDAPDDSSTLTQRPVRILLFNQQTRDADALARSLYNTVATALDDPHPFTHVVFCTNRTFQETGYRPDLISLNSNAHATQALEVQTRLAQTWGGLDASADVKVVSSISQAVRWARDVAGAPRTRAAVLVTGSVHLVGGFLEVLETGGTDYL
jgi:folylpolyglutamate synthase